MRYIATIKWLDNGDIQDDMILKVGDIEEDDDEIFFYLEDEKEIKSFKKEGSHDWVIINIEKENYEK
tara:strand:+ start:651 stop:851 length:201 start_codon:yes stop_codon:yes gene_type:complete